MPHLRQTTGTDFPVLIILILRATGARRGCVPVIAFVLYCDSRGRDSSVFALMVSPGVELVVMGWLLELMKLELKLPLREKGDSSLLTATELERHLKLGSGEKVLAEMYSLSLRGSIFQPKPIRQEQALLQAHPKGQ